MSDEKLFRHLSQTQSQHCIGFLSAIGKHYEIAGEDLESQGLARQEIEQIVVVLD